MATFTPASKSSPATWTNQPHSDIEGAGFDEQTFDQSTFDETNTNNIIQTQWSNLNKEVG